MSNEPEINQETLAPHEKRFLSLVVAAVHLALNQRDEMTLKALRDAETEALSKSIISTNFGKKH